MQYNAAKLEDQVKMFTFLLLLYLVSIRTTFPQQNFYYSEAIASCKMVLQYSLGPGGRLLLKKGKGPTHKPHFLSPFTAACSNCLPQVSFSAECMAIH